MFLYNDDIFYLLFNKMFTVQDIAPPISSLPNKTEMCSFLSSQRLLLQFEEAVRLSLLLRCPCIAEKFFAVKKDISHRGR